jgi:ankyrin repeat protein
MADLDLGRDEKAIEEFVEECGKSSKNRLKEIMKKWGEDLYINDYDSYGYTPLTAAVYGNRIDLVRFLLKHGADINQTDGNGSTPATTAYTTEMLKYLIKKRADVNKPDGLGHTALEMAAGYSRPMTKILLKAGAGEKLKL